MTIFIKIYFFRNFLVNFFVQKFPLIFFGMFFFQLVSISRECLIFLHNLQKTNIGCKFTIVIFFRQTFFTEMWQLIVTFDGKCYNSIVIFDGKYDKADSSKNNIVTLCYNITSTFRQKCQLLHFASKYDNQLSDFASRNVSINCHIFVRNVTIGHFCSECACHIYYQNIPILTRFDNLGLIVLTKI